MVPGRCNSNQQSTQSDNWCNFDIQGHTKQREYQILLTVVSMKMFTVSNPHRKKNARCNNRTTGTFVCFTFTKNTEST